MVKNHVQLGFMEKLRNSMMDLASSKFRHPLSVEEINHTELLVGYLDFIIINFDFITLKLFYRYIALMVSLQAC